MLKYLSKDIAYLSIFNFGFKIYNNKKVPHCINFPIFCIRIIAGRLLIKINKWVLEIGIPV